MSEFSYIPKCSECPNKLGCVGSCRFVDEFSNMPSGARIKKERELAHKYQKLEAKKEAARQEIKRLETVVEATKRGLLCAPKSHLSVSRLKKGLSTKAFCANSNEAAEAALYNAGKIPWFDFRFIKDLGGVEMENFGFDLVKNGIVKLPFKECVFVFNYLLDGVDYSVITSLVQGDRIEEKFFCMAAKSFPHIAYVGSPEEDKSAHPTEVYNALAILASREATQQKTRDSDGTIATLKTCAHSSSSSHNRIVIRSEILNGNSSGDGPRKRLHWRRGHIRHLSTGKVSWIRATLVGRSEGVAVPKDYQMQGARPLSGWGQ